MYLCVKFIEKTMIERIQKLIEEVSALQAQNAAEVEALRIKYLSKKGEISALMNDFRTVPAEMKKELGMRINELKTCAMEKINALRDAIQVAEVAGDRADVGAGADHHRREGVAQIVERAVEAVHLAEGREVRLYNGVHH